jgi:hypothetical protein
MVHAPTRSSGRRQFGDNSRRIEAKKDAHQALLGIGIRSPGLGTTA